MARHFAEDDDEEKDGDWHDEGEDDPVVWDDEGLTIPCPYCREEIHEDSSRCPHCERYISREDAPPTRWPWWVVIGFILAFFVAFMWVM